MYDIVDSTYTGETRFSGLTTTAIESIEPVPMDLIQ